MKYVTVFEEKGRYYPHFDVSEVGRENGIEAGKRLFGAIPVYVGELQYVKQGKIVTQFVSEANKTGTFDSKRLEELLSVPCP